MSKTILVVDDEADALEMLQYNLRKEGYVVTTARDGKKAIESARQVPDLILLDVLLPEMDGWEVCKTLKRDPGTASIPVLFLTAKESEFDEVLGLELGADDYIVKPIAIRSLMARVKVALRRKSANVQLEALSSDIIKVEGLEINLPNFQVLVEETDVPLTKKEFETLVYLARSKGRVISRLTLIQSVWGDDVRVIPRTVDVHISRLREKLKPYDKFIETVKGVGYRFKT